jgi:hypothetical protein
MGVNVVRMVSVNDYAKVTCRSPKTVRTMCAEGRIRGAVKISGVWMIDLEKAKGTVFNRRGRPAAGRTQTRLK